MADGVKFLMIYLLIGDFIFAISHTVEDSKRAQFFATADILSERLGVHLLSAQLMLAAYVISVWPYTLCEALVDLLFPKGGK
jgi:hypothetical protein